MKNVTSNPCPYYMKNRVFSQGVEAQFDVLFCIQRAMHRRRDTSPRELAHERTCISLTVDGDCRQSRWSERCASAPRGIEIAWRVRATESVGACSQKDLSLFPPYDIQVDCGFILGMLKSNCKERTEPTDGI